MTTEDRRGRVTRVLEGMEAWTVLVAQYNDRVAERLGVSPSDLQCLYVLARHGPSTAGTLARAVDLTSGAASRMLDRLQAAGHVRRVRDADDRRRVVVEAVPASLDAVAALYAPLTDRLRADLETVDDDGLAHLERFARAAQEITAAAVREP